MTTCLVHGPVVRLRPESNGERCDQRAFLNDWEQMHAR